jgi:hypothetical protein
MNHRFDLLDPTLYIFYDVGTSLKVDHFAILEGSILIRLFIV